MDFLALRAGVTRRIPLRDDVGGVSLAIICSVVLTVAAPLSRAAGARARHAQTKKPTEGGLSQAMRKRTTSTNP